MTGGAPPAMRRRGNHSATTGGSAMRTSTAGRKTRPVRRQSPKARRLRNMFAATGLASKGPDARAHHRGCLKLLGGADCTARAFLQRRARLFRREDDLVLRGGIGERKTQQAREKLGLLAGLTEVGGRRDGEIFAGDGAETNRVAIGRFGVAALKVDQYRVEFDKRALHRAQRREERVAAGERAGKRIDDQGASSEGEACSQSEE